MKRGMGVKLMPHTPPPSIPLPQKKISSKSPALLELTEGIDVAKINNSKEYKVCHYWFFNHGFKFSNVVCNGWQDLPMLCLNIHCVKSVQIRSFFWYVVSHILNKYGDLRSTSRYSARIQENTDQKISVFRHFSRIVKNSYYCCILYSINKFEATNLFENYVLDDRGCIYKMHINIIKNRVHNRFGDLK